MRILKAREAGQHRAVREQPCLGRTELDQAEDRDEERKPRTTSREEIYSIRVDFNTSYQSCSSCLLPIGSQDCTMDATIPVSAGLCRFAVQSLTDTVHGRYSLDGEGPRRMYEDGWVQKVCRPEVDGVDRARGVEEVDDLTHQYEPEILRVHSNPY